MDVTYRQVVLLLALWGVLMADVALVVSAQTSYSLATASSSATDTSNTTVVDVVPPISTPYASSTDLAVPPVGTVQPAAYFTTDTTNADTAYICNGDEVARLAKLSENNPYLHSRCTSLAGISSYVFPFNGELGYTQMVAMGLIQECQYYFRAVLLVQLQECVVANVYVRTTAETILQLAATSGNAPTEAQVDAAKGVRKTYNLALRDGQGSASYSATEGASALSWTIEGDTIDTIASVKTDGQLLMSTDLHVVGTYYPSSSTSSSRQEDPMETPSPSALPNEKDDAWTSGLRVSTSGSGRSGVSSWLVVVSVACTWRLHSSLK
uniref:Uncharacterized protein n=1 Tax=Peronospora matthiolae TaxID=2874970 RepID=A0AAV1U4Y1_9STRA